jgi:hypothetical protein
VQNKHGASKIIDTFETYHPALFIAGFGRGERQRLEVLLGLARVLDRCGAAAREIKQTPRAAKPR